MKHFKRVEPNRISLNGKRHYIVPDGFIVPEGLVLPSLTTVLSATAPVGKIMALMNWRKRVGAEEANRRTRMAADRGTWMHKVIEDFFDEQDIETALDLSPKYRPYFDAIYDFLLTIDQCVLAESAIAYWFAPGFGYTGTFDQLAIIDGQYVLIDWKTSYKEKPDYQLADYRQQLGGYAQAIEQMYDIEIDRALCVNAVYDPEDPESKPSRQIIEADGGELVALGSLVRNRTARYFADHYPGGTPFTLTMDKG